MINLYLFWIISNFQIKMRIKYLFISYGFYESRYEVMDQLEERKKINLKIKWF